MLYTGGGTTCRSRGPLGLSNISPKIRGAGYIMSGSFKIRDSPSATQRPTHAPSSSSPTIWRHPKGIPFQLLRAPRSLPQAVLGG